MSEQSHLDGVVDWALARVALAQSAVEGKASRRKPAAFPRLVAGSPLRALAERWQLAAEELQIVGLVAAADRSIAFSSSLRALSGGGLTVAAARAIVRLDAARADELLGPAGTLRRCGWLAIDALAGGLPDAADTLRFAPGMAARIDGRVPNPASLGIGVERLVTSATRVTSSEALASFVRDDVLGGDRATPSLALGGIAHDEALQVAQILAQRLRRDVLFVDGAAVGALAPGDAWTLLAALRREAILDELPVVVHPATRLHGAFRALLAAAPPSAAASTLPLHVIFIDDDKALDGRVADGVRVIQRAAASSASAVPRAPAADEPAPARVPTQHENELDAARRKAARDAARALGQSYDLYPEPPPPAAAPPPVVAPPPMPIAAPAAVAPPPVIAAAEAPAPNDPAIASAAVAADDAVSVSPPPAVDEPASATSPAAAAGAADPDESLPFIAVPSSVTGADLIQYIAQATNPLQRAELLRRLSSQGRDLQIVAFVRAHVKVDHPAVRAAAEEGMAKLFGPNWNKTRPIPKPVQPPRSDDGQG